MKGAQIRWWKLSLSATSRPFSHVFTRSLARARTSQKDQLTWLQPLRMTWQGCSSWDKKDKWLYITHTICIHTSRLLTSKCSKLQKKIQLYGHVHKKNACEAVFRGILGVGILYRKRMVKVKVVNISWIYQLTAILTIDLQFLAMTSQESNYPSWSFNSKRLWRNRRFVQFGKELSLNQHFYHLSDMFQGELFV